MQFSNAVWQNALQQWAGMLAGCPVRNCRREGDDAETSIEEPCIKVHAIAAQGSARAAERKVAVAAARIAEPCTRLHAKPGLKGRLRESKQEPGWLDQSELRYQSHVLSAIPIDGFDTHKQGHACIQ